MTQKRAYQYAELARDTIQGNNKTGIEVYDSVLTPLFKIEVAELGQVIKNFFPYAKGPEKWGCVVYYENKEYKK